jgi:hypothetical protein
MGAIPFNALKRVLLCKFVRWGGFNVETFALEHNRMRIKGRHAIELQGRDILPTAFRLAGASRNLRVCGWI